jgi:hypothetical protein
MKIYYSDKINCKNAISTIVILILSLNVKAQTHEFSLSGSYIIPNVSFSEKSLDNYSGFDKYGVGSNFDYHLYFCRFFGINMNINYSYIYFDENSVKGAYNSVLHQNSGIFAINSGNYEIFSIMPGYVFRCPLLKRLELQFSVNHGFSRVTEPNIIVKDTEYGTLKTFQNEKINGYTDKIGISLKYSMQNKYGFILGYNYTFPYLAFETRFQSFYFGITKFLKNEKK